MKFVMIIAVMLNGQLSVTTAEYDDAEACDAAGRAFLERTAKNLDIIWECSPKSSSAN